MSGGLKESLVEVLERFPGGLRKEQIGRELKGVSLSAVVDGLELLRRDRVVEIDGRLRWKLLNPGAPSERGSDAVARVGPPSREVGKRWRSFRQLCRYYAQCVRLEERPNVTADAEREGRDFIQIGRGVDWQALASGQSVRLTLDQSLRKFIQALRRSRRGVRLFLGSPADVKTFAGHGSKARQRIVSPVFVIQVEYSVDREDLILSPQFVVNVNLGWLERRHGKSQFGAQDEFLESVGLRDDDQRGDEAEQRTPSRFVSNLRVLYDGLRVSQRDWWREPGSLERPSATPAISELKEDGFYNRILLMAEPALKYSRGLIHELEHLADSSTDEELESSAIPLLFPSDGGFAPSMADTAGTSDANAKEPFVAAYQLLNDEQRCAVAQGLSSPLTVVTGPPGTGKSVVVGHVLANMALREHSALFSSRNHQAIAAVEPRLNALVEPDMLVMRPTRRFEESTSDAQSWVQLVSDLLVRPQKPGAGEAFEKSIRDVENVYRQTRELEEIAYVQLQNNEELAALQQQIAKLLASFRPAAYTVVSSLPKLPRKRTLERLAKALDAPVQERGLRRAMSRLLQAFVSGPLRARTARRVWQQGLERIPDRTVLAPLPINAGRRDLAAGLRKLALLSEAVDLVRRSSEVESHLRASRDIGDVKESLSRLHRELVERSREGLQAVVGKSGGALSPSERELFASVRGALKLRGNTSNPERQSQELTQALRKHFSSLIRHYPVWAVTNLSARSALPLSAGAFELLVIDEASQCDIASVVPLLFRARRVLVVGDPMQLPPVFKLPRQADRQLRSRLHLDDDMRWGRFLHCANSFFDLASSSARLEPSRDMILLSVHFRCHSVIADYCNRSFYRKTLRVRTNHDRLNAPHRGGRAWEGPLCQYE